jgi:hypothetical protein
MAKKVIKKAKSKKKSEKSAKPAAHPVEYLVTPINVTETPEALMNQLNTYGKDGWELVWCTGSPGMGSAQAWFMKVD